MIVTDSRGVQVWPQTRKGDRGNSWHLHLACDADLGTRCVEYRALAALLTIETREAAR